MWGYDELSEVQAELLMKGVIDLGGSVDENMERYVREAILRLIAKGSPPITVIISSNGGPVHNGLDIFDALNMYPGKKTGIVHNFAESVAAVILQACTHRIATRHAELLIHHLSKPVSLDEMRDPKKLEDFRSQMEKTQARLDKILISRTGKTKKEIFEKCIEDTSMTAEEALAFGLIDEITDSYPVGFGSFSQPQEGE